MIGEGNIAQVGPVREGVGPAFAPREMDIELIGHWQYNNSDWADSLEVSMIVGHPEPLFRLCALK